MKAISAAVTASRGKRWALAYLGRVKTRARDKRGFGEEMGHISGVGALQGESTPQNSVFLGGMEGAVSGTFASLQGRVFS